MGCGSGMTCWRRLHEWNEAGVWQRLHQVLLDELQDTGQVDSSRAVVDSSHVRAERASRPAPRRSTAPGLAVEHHLIVDGNGTPLAVTLTGGTATTSRSSPSLWIASRRPAATANSDPAGSTPTGPTTPNATAKTPRPRHHPTDRQTENRQRIRPRKRALDRRAHDRLAARPPLSRPPPRAARRHPRSHAHPRLRPHLPQQVQRFC